jgi:hypothetical protein
LGSLLLVSFGWAKRMGNNGAERLDLGCIQQLKAGEVLY